jgi:phage repressor protein C with HTH and peptisase S24 domain
MTIYTERGSVEPLLRGETVEVRGIGNSMTPILKSGEISTVEPLKSTDQLNKGDIVIAKVKGRVYMHLVKGIKGDQVLIGNNHGHNNGWTSRSNIFGRAK